MRLFYLSLFFIIGAAGLTFYFSELQNPGQKANAVIIQEKAVAEAKALYRKAVIARVDLKSGPCLSNDLMKDWVVDTAHDPRESLDDLPSNQCQAFLEGRAKHFVELDITGNLIRVR